ncbi:hypothetical protein DFH07DRAFT_786029 [Mycena maculata]|uniref:Uncharacterized protein n=1 Tax=Mycena maculata TaxID=230809 RepID=A0AAD7MDG7_9AGAR|nr:hypothetical protein DFH07DRAFT_786029 [Mycena maculata]
MLRCERQTHHEPYQELGGFPSQPRNPNAPSSARRSGVITRWQSATSAELRKLVLFFNPLPLLICSTQWVSRSAQRHPRKFKDRDRTSEYSLAMALSSESYIKEWEECYSFPRWTISIPSRTVEPQTVFKFLSTFRDGWGEAPLNHTSAGILFGSESVYESDYHKRLSSDPTHYEDHDRRRMSKRDEILRAPDICHVITFTDTSSTLGYLALDLSVGQVPGFNHAIQYSLLPGCTVQARRDLTPSAYTVLSGVGRNVFGRPLVRRFAAELGLRIALAAVAMVSGLLVHTSAAALVDAEHPVDARIFVWVETRVKTALGIEQGPIPRALSSEIQSIIRAYETIADHVKECLHKLGDRFTAA